MTSLKQKLLDTGYFINNEWLEKYLALVVDVPVSFSYTEKHHVIPTSCSKLLGKRSADDSKSNLVNLTFVDHCRAHFYLYHCTKGKLKKAMAVAYVTMTGDWSKLKAELTEDEYTLLAARRAELKNNSGSHWSTDDLEFLKLNYQKIPIKAIATALQKTESAVSHRVTSLGLSEVRWTEDQLSFLRINWLTMTSTELAKALNKTKSAVEHKALRLNLASKNLIRNWTPEQDAWLRENYLTKKDKVCAEYLGKTIAAVLQHRKVLGLTKNK